MSNIATLLQTAVAHQQQGRLAEARKLYEQALRAQPRNADALHLLGLACLDGGQTERGLQLIRRAIAYRPGYLEAINNIAIELARRDRHDEARGFLETALRLRPNQPDVQFNLARSLSALKRTADALAAYDRVLALQPDHHQAWTNRAGCLSTLGRHRDALDSAARAIALRPDAAEAWLNRGNALQELGDLQGALAAFDHALVLRPDDTDALARKGDVLNDLHRCAEALECLDRALARDPGNVAARVARGIALLLLDRREEALAWADRLLAEQPADASAWGLHAAILHDLDRDADALASFDRALVLNPDDPDTRRNRGYALLQLGRLAEAWPDHELRLQSRVIFPAGKPGIAPDWQGEDLSGRHIAVYTEQGLGDILHFVRYLSMLLPLAGKVTLLAPARLHALLAAAFPAIALVAEPEQAAGADFQSALLSLPLRFGTDMDSIPAATPYLVAEEARVARWRDWLGEHGFRAGICWQGSTWNGAPTGRSFPLAEFAALADLPGLRLISLQSGFGTEQLANPPPGMAVEIPGPDFDAGPDAFVDTAALMQSLDLVITCDTSIGHLAGALARPVWVAMPFAGDWRWLRHRTDTPWYPGMRLFRQSAARDWNEVFGNIRTALGETIAATRKAGP